MWSFGLGKPTEENRLEKQVAKPKPTVETETTPWVPYTGREPKSSLRPAGPALMYTIFNQVAVLCQITQEITAWLYGKKRFKAGTLIEHHARLKAWRDNLPEPLQTLKLGSTAGLFYMQ